MAGLFLIKPDFESSIRSARSWPKQLKVPFHDLQGALPFLSQDDEIVAMNHFDTLELRASDFRGAETR